MTKAVFISSTFDDLKSYRHKIWELLERYDVNIRGMERFGARKEAPLITCLSEVEQSDVFVGVIAFRLGSIDESSGKSFTQREYERASELNREILIYMMDEKDSKISPEYFDFGDRREKLLAFKSILKERHTVDFFVSEDDLAERMERKFNELLASKAELEEPSQDEYARSKELIDRFLLLPRIYSGREVRLKVDFAGKPFPASKSLCSSFNLDYGKTIGVKVKIDKPVVDANALEYIFIDEDNLDSYFSLKRQNDVDLYGKLQFSENKIDDARAHFVREEYGQFSGLTIMPAWLGERKIIEADGKAIIKLTKFIEQ